MTTNHDPEEPQIPGPGQPDDGTPASGAVPGAQSGGHPAGGHPASGPDTGPQPGPYPGPYPGPHAGHFAGHFGGPDAGPYASGTPVPPPDRPGTGFFDWIRNLGIRRGRARWIGGVASGIAERLGIDPVLVRGLVVVLALFFGVGVLAYGVAWALLPEPDGRIHVEEVGRGHWSSGMTGAAIFTLLGLAGPGRGLVFRAGDGWFPWPIFWVAAVVAVVIWALNRDKSRRPGNRERRQDTGDEWAAGPQPYRPAPSGPGGASPGTPQNLPAGPLAPNAGYAPNADYGRTLTRRSNHPGAAAVAVSTGVAILVAAGVLLLNTAGMFSLGGHAAATAWAAGAVTLGIGIVVAGLRGRTSGGMGFFAVVALLVAGTLSLVPNSSSWALARNETWSPAGISAAQDGFSIAMGRGDINLTSLAGSAPLAQDVVVPVSLAAAQVGVTLPANIPVTIQSQLAAAQISVDGQNTSAAAVGNSTLSLNQTAPGHRIVLALRGAAGHVTITVNGSGNTK
ncbi:MAG: PspC domain-containing protein [Actinomycetota bacterium]|nr:PspC domain-containing protein [Actinomycetota bacterium]